VIVLAEVPCEGTDRSACRPGATDHSHGPTEALCFQTAPQLGTIATAGGPLRVEEGETGLKSALANPEDID
jgi:hypothetical protein